jgi:hypothetical protein
VALTLAGSLYVLINGAVEEELQGRPPLESKYSDNMRKLARTLIKIGGWFRNTSSDDEDARLERRNTYPTSPGEEARNQKIHEIVELEQVTVEGASRSRSRSRAGSMREGYGSDSQPASPIVESPLEKMDSLQVPKERSQSFPTQSPNDSIGYGGTQQHDWVQVRRPGRSFTEPKIPHEGRAVTQLPSIKSD